MSSLYSKNVFYLFYPFIDKLYTVVLCWLVITDWIFLLLLCPLQSNPYLHTLHTDKTYKKVNIVIWCQSSKKKIKSGSWFIQKCNALHWLKIRIHLQIMPNQSLQGSLSILISALPGIQMSPNRVFFLFHETFKYM